MCVVSGDHDSIVQGKRHVETVRLINAIIHNEQLPELVAEKSFPPTSLN